MDWSREADRARPLQDAGAAAGRPRPGLDDHGRPTRRGDLIASGRTYPANPAISFADRDYFQALSKAPGGAALPYVEMPISGRQTEALPVFNVAGRTNPGPGRRLHRCRRRLRGPSAYFQQFYKLPRTGHRTTASCWCATDGYDPGQRAEAAVRSSAAEFEAAQRYPDASTSGSYSLHSRLDGVDRIFAFRRIGAYPIFVRFGIARSRGAGALVHDARQSTVSPPSWRRWRCSSSRRSPCARPSASAWRAANGRRPPLRFRRRRPNASASRGSCGNRRRWRRWVA